MNSILLPGAQPRKLLECIGLHKQCSRCSPTSCETLDLGHNGGYSSYQSVAGSPSVFRSHFRPEAFLTPAQSFLVRTVLLARNGDEVLPVRVPGAGFWAAMDSVACSERKDP